MKVKHENFDENEKNGNQDGNRNQKDTEIMKSQELKPGCSWKWLLWFDWRSRDDRSSGRVHGVRSRDRYIHCTIKHDASIDRKWIAKHFGKQIIVVRAIVSTQSSCLQHIWNSVVLLWLAILCSGRTLSLQYSAACVNRWRSIRWGQHDVLLFLQLYTFSANTALLHTLLSML